MGTWPSIADTDDRRLAESLRIIGPAGLMQVYDTYAPLLYDYCRALSPDGDAAATALHNAVIAAAQHASRLRDPERFRGWLYALAHQECLRGQESPTDPGGSAAATGHGETGTATSAAVATNAPPAEERPATDASAALPDADIIVASALPALTTRQRDAVRLAVRHEIPPADVAAILGFSEQNGAEEVDRIVERLADALTVPAAISAAALDCPSGVTMLKVGPRTADHFKRLAKHVRSCASCGRYESMVVPVTTLLQAAPPAPLPSDLRTRVHRTATSPDHAETRQRIAARAEPFDRAGWPVVTASGHRPGEKIDGRSGRLLWPVVSLTATVTVVAGVAVACLPDWGGPAGSHLDRLRGGNPANPLPTGLDQPNDDITGRRTGEAAGSSPASPPTPDTRSPRADGSDGAGGGDSGGSGGTGTASLPSPRPPRSVSARGCMIPAGRDNCQITLTSSGGSWQWRVTGTSWGLDASGSGTLASGQSTKVTVRRTVPCISDGAGVVTFNEVGSVPVPWDCP